MPVFAAIGVALGFSGTAAAVAGGIAVAGTAAAIGTSIYSSQEQAQDARVDAQRMQDQYTTNLGRLSSQEAQDTASKRLARVGRYFTSPLGDTSNISTASQKVFS